MFLPSDSPYEIEILLDHVDWYAKRHGQVLLEIDRYEWIVRAPRDETPEACSVCHTRLTSLTFVNGSRVRLCTSCARKEVAAKAIRWPWRLRQGSAAR